MKKRGYGADEGALMGLRDWSEEVKLQEKRMEFDEFLESRRHSIGDGGFKPYWMPDMFFDFQRFLCEWEIRKGRSATFADCGMGKTALQLTWAENVVRHTNKPVLVLTPNAVSAQTVTEGTKFGIECKRSKDGTIPAKITITNYENLSKFNWQDFSGAVCDESSILKSYDGTRRQEITEFMRKMQYRALFTATPSPNDYIELGTSSEALGHLGHMDMLNRFFKNDMNNSAQGRVHGKIIEWRFKGHAEEAFWKYVVSWARAVRKPSDLGFSDGGFVLPDLVERTHVVRASRLADGMLFEMPAFGMREQREENRRTVEDRCEMVAQLVSGHPSSLCWGDLNDECDLMEKLIPGAAQVSGRDSDDAKEEKFAAFCSGQIKRLVTKRKIAAWGLNFQHCSHMTTFPSNSYEQYYQGIRRCWRFGQQNKVISDIVTTEGGAAVMENQRRKAVQAEKMFAQLVGYMNNALGIEQVNNFTTRQEVPAWL